MRDQSAVVRVSGLAHNCRYHKSVLGEPQRGWRMATTNNLVGAGTMIYDVGNGYAPRIAGNPGLRRRASTPIAATRPPFHCRVKP
jgi:hypothetical protein